MLSYQNITSPCGGLIPCSILANKEKMSVGYYLQFNFATSLFRVKSLVFSELFCKVQTEILNAAFPSVYHPFLLCLSEG